MAAIPAFSFLRKLGRVYIFAEDTFRILQYPSVKQSLILPKIYTLESILKENNIIREALPPELQIKLDEIVEGEKKLVEDYSIIIINQSLAILVSLFESFLVETLETLLDFNNQILIGLAEQKEIKLEDNLKLGSYDKVINSFKDKILRKFAFSSTEDQFEKFYKSIGFDIGSFFDMSNFTKDVQIKYHGWDLSKLASITDERHNIVHNDKFPIDSLESLHLRKEYLDKIILNIAKEVYLKFGLPNDFNIPLTTKTPKS